MESPAKIPSPKELMVSYCQRREVQLDDLARGRGNTGFDQPGELKALEEPNGNLTIGRRNRATIFTEYTAV